MPNSYKPGLIQVRPQYSGAAADVPENILWFIGVPSAGYTATQLAAIRDVFDPLWGNMWKQIGSASASYISAEVTDWQSNTGISVLPAAGFNVPGIASGQCGSNVAFLISRQIGIRWRGGHPRTYLPLCAGANLTTERAWATTPITAMETAYTNLIAGMNGISGANGGPFQEVVFRFKNTPTKAQTFLIDTYTFQGTPASQRRRLRRVTRK